MKRAVVIGEALIDLLSTEDGASLTPVVGGAPFNVAVGLSRLGTPTRLLTAVGGDAYGERLVGFARSEGVDVDGIVRVPAPTPLALTTLDRGEPSFTFYGDPPAYAMFAPSDLDLGMIASAGALYCGSIALLGHASLAAARLAWRQRGPVKIFDPNVRPLLLPDRYAVAACREVVEEFAADADLVKLSHADVAALYGSAPPISVALRLRALGARVVVVTLGAAGAVLVKHRIIGPDRHPSMAVDVISPADGVFGLPTRPGPIVDTTGAGDSVAAALIHRLLAGFPDTDDGWIGALDYAMRVSAVVCARRGGAAAMPTPADLDS